jgi:hypothetical protein
VQNAIFGEEVFDFQDNLQIIRKHTAIARVESELSLLRASDVEDMAVRFPELKRHIVTYRAKRARHTELRSRTNALQRSSSNTDISDFRLAAGRCCVTTYLSHGQCEGDRHAQRP